MSSAKERLGELLALAAERRWAALARELAALTLDWPRDFPGAMRTPVMALFELAARECDDATRAEIAAKMGGNAELPLRLLNELYLAAPAPLRREILMRNQLECEDGADDARADATGLIRAARNGALDFAAALAAAVAIPHDIAATILADASGEPLAVLCRGAGLDRAAFSTIALLRGAPELPQAVFDTVPEEAARRLTRQWRAHHVDHSYTDRAAAAE
jgi:hypothetical protein